MGRIDDALRRANLDAGRGTGAPALAPGPSPWRFEERSLDEARALTPETGNGASAPAGPVTATSAPEPRIPRNGHGQVARPARWGGYDPAVLERLVVSEGAGPLLVEQFRSLGAVLVQAQGEQHITSVMVTSASPGDGKSLVSVNLGLTLAESYHRRVLLVDADLRRPSLHRVFRAANLAGLAEGLKTEEGGDLHLIRITDTLSLLPAGRSDSSPLGGLASNRMKSIVEQASSLFDWVIVDTPPVGMLADGRVVFDAVDAAILVVRAGATPFHDLEAAAETLGRDRILGIVLNAVDPAEIRGQSYHNDYYGYHDAERSGS
jgi:protein-tyrosine kinase